MPPSVLPAAPDAVLPPAPGVTTVLPHWWAGAPDAMLPARTKLTARASKVRFAVSASSAPAFMAHEALSPSLTSAELELRCVDVLSMSLYVFPV